MRRFLNAKNKSCKQKEFEKIARVRSNICIYTGWLPYFVIFWIILYQKIVYKFLKRKGIYWHHKYYV